jgi:hypothetical protein
MKYKVRIVLGTVSVLCIAKLRRSIESKYGKDCSVAFALLMMTQFHLPFYMSRTLPNTFALCLGILLNAVE